MRKTWLLTIALIFFTPVFAEDSGSVERGASEYDWQTCIDSKSNDCVNTICTTSEDIDCQDNCDSMAQDKCRAEGISPPQ